MPYKDPEKQKVAQRASYERQLEKYRVRSKARYWARKAWLVKLFEGLKCARCPEAERVCIDLHHVDPKMKEAKVVELWRNGSSPTKIIAEIEKCVPLCSNCHRKFHAGLFQLENVVTIVVSEDMKASLPY